MSHILKVLESHFLNELRGEFDQMKIRQPDLETACPELVDGYRQLDLMACRLFKAADEYELNASR